MAGTRSGPSWRRTSVRYREWAVARPIPGTLRRGPGFCQWSLILPSSPARPLSLSYEVLPVDREHH